MTINFKNIEAKDIPSFKGGEGSFHVNMFSDDKNKIMRGRLVPGSSIGYHQHVGNAEYIFILQGSPKVIFDGVEERLEPGVCSFCPEGHSHSLINDTNEDVEFFAVVPELR
ncbi:MAG: cupin domain-containing protein [Spirochaetales bacterium]|nr:cupin domain-containing protein [Candidatus Physcosoma equi]